MLPTVDSPLQPGGVRLAGQPYGGVSMRSIWAGLSAALLVIGLATASWAQNGLERFEKEIKPQLELKKFTYANAAAAGRPRASS